MTDVEDAQEANSVCSMDQRRVYYDGYWIKAYEVPADTLLAREALDRRADASACSIMSSMA